MRFPELAGDTAADNRIDMSADFYAESAPDDSQASALTDFEYRVPAGIDDRDDDALARPSEVQRSAKGSTERTDQADEQLHLIPVIPRQSVCDETPDMDANEISEPERLEIDGGVNEVVLKELGHEDAVQIFSLVNFDTEHFTSVGEVTPEVCGSVDDVQTWLADVKSGMPEGWERVELGIWHQTEMVGCTGYAAKGQQAIFWNWVGKEHIGHGYGGDSIRTLVPHLIQRGHRVIEAQVRVDNGASRRNMQKTGFEPVDQRNGYIRFRFNGHDTSQPYGGTA